MATATRTAALGVGLLLLGACAHETPGASDRVSTTLMTSYVVSESDGCRADLHETVQFESSADTLTRAEKRDLERWASCLARPEMKDETVILTGGRDPESEPRLFRRRAEAVRAALIAHGIEPARIVIGAPNAARAGGRLGASDEIRLEISGGSSLRTMR